MARDKASQPDLTDDNQQDENYAPDIATDRGSVGVGDEKDLEAKDEGPWGVSASVQQANDPLLNCLVTLTKLLDRPHSRDSLVAGLPLNENGMSPALFIRAAGRVGISAKLVSRNLGQITSLVLPAVLLFKSREACILVGYTKDRKAKIVMPESGGVTEMPIKELEKRYSGYALFAKPEFRLDQRAREIEEETPDSWFRRTISKFTSLYVEVFMASFFINIFTLASSLFIMNVYDRVVPNNALETLWVLAAGVVIVYVFDFTLRTLRAHFLDVAGKSTDTIISARLFQHLMGMELGNRPPSAGVLAGQLREFDHLREFYTSATLVTLVDLPFLILFLVVIGYIGGPLAMIPMVAIPVLVIVGLAIQRSINKVIRETFRESAQKNALLVESITGLETIKICGAEGAFQRNWEKFVGHSARSSMKSYTLSAVGQNFTLFVTNMVSTSIVVYGVHLIAEGELTTGGLIASVILSGRAMAPLAQAAGLLTRISMARNSLRELNRFMGLPVERAFGRTFLHRPSLRGNVEFRNVTFQYPNSGHKALNSVSFKIQHGEKVGIIGPMGSGKSTLSRLLINLYQPTTGSVIVDGTDARQIDPADLRRNIGVLPQDVFLFFGTVRDNIALGHPEIDDHALLMAGTTAGVTDFLRHHPQGYDMLMGERGEGLSGGQKQSIALARAMVMDPPILVFDEPTSSMDPGSENRFIARMRKRAADKTLVMITHRSSMLQLVDRLIVMSNGQIVADGPRDEVVKQLQAGDLKAAL